MSGVFLLLKFFQPQTWEGQIVCICYATLGIPIFLMSLARISGILSEVYRFLYGRVLCYPCTNFGNTKPEQVIKPKAKSDVENMAHFEGNDIKGKVVDEEDEVDEEEEEEQVKDHVSVPLFFVVSTFGGYIVLGMFIFYFLESWTFLQGAYYTYVTLSTMGKLYKPLKIVIYIQ